jgi:hypothetical protein
MEITLMNIKRLVLLASVITLSGFAKDEQSRFHLKNNSDGPITVVLHGEFGDSNPKSAAADLAIEDDFTGELRSIDITQDMQTYTFTFTGNVNEDTTYYLKFEKIGAWAGLKVQEGNLRGRTTEGYSLKNNFKGKVERLLAF